MLLRIVSAPAVLTVARWVTPAEPEASSECTTKLPLTSSAYSRKLLAGKATPPGVVSVIVLMSTIVILRIAVPSGFLKGATTAALQEGSATTYQSTP